MTTNIADILGRKQFEEPHEIEIIKDYLNQKFQSTAHVKIQEKRIVISVSNAALAGALRMQLHSLQDLCRTEKRLIIRIS